jgi:hypothetical protein
MTKKAEKAKGQILFCDKCGKRWSVSFDHCRSVLQIGELTDKSHKEVSPNCKQPVWQIGMFSRVLSKEKRREVMNMPLAEPSVPF